MKVLTTIAFILFLSGCSAPSTTPMSDAETSDTLRADSGPLRTDGAVPDASVVDARTVPNDAHADAEVPDTHITVAACDSLSAVGTWENITPPCPGGLAAGYITQSISIDQQNPGTMYLGWGSPQGHPGCGISKTTDCGATWTHVNTGTHGADIDGAGHWTLTVDPVDSRNVYTANGYGPNGVFKSTNGGVDWQQILPPDIANVLIFGGFVERITIDPTDHLHLLVSPHFNCQNGHTDCMIETHDGGTTWTVLDGTPSGGEDAGQLMLDSQTWLWAGGGGLFRTSNAGSSWARVYNGWVYDSIYRSPTGIYYLMSAQSGVLSSTDTITWSEVANSPHNGRAVIGDGNTLFTSARGHMDTPYQPYASAPESAPTTWHSYPSTPMSQGGWILQYDASHHLLYSSNEAAGLWRVVTR